MLLQNHIINVKTVITCYNRFDFKTVIRRLRLEQDEREQPLWRERFCGELEQLRRELVTCPGCGDVIRIATDS